MHDYDRRSVLSADAATTITRATTLHTFDFKDLVQDALWEQTTRVTQLEARHVGDKFQLEGTTADGRAFTGVVTLDIDERKISATVSVRLEGSISRGPLPPELARVEAELSKGLAALKASGHGPDERLFEILPIIENWRRGNPVDTEVSFLRTKLRQADDLLQNIRQKLPEPVKQMVPPGEGKKLWQILEAAGKAIRGALRTLK